jgi:hypothetical protein
MFIENKYTKWYYAIIYNSKSSDNYCELHHIIPRSLGGSNDLTNVIKLTAREHFVCHWLLSKMLEGQRKEKMIYALRLMCKRKLHNERVTSRVYENTKQLHAATMSKRHKGKTLNQKQKDALADANVGRKWTEEQHKIMSAKLKGRVFSEEAKEKMSASAKKRDRSPHSEETKRKIAKSNSKPLSEERKRRISAAHRGKKLSPETIAKRTETQRSNRMKINDGGLSEIVKRPSDTSRSLESSWYSTLVLHHHWS